MISVSLLWRAVRLGIKGLLLHKLRSSLTVLGTVFGVMSVIAMLAVGEGASQEAQEQIRQLGSTNIIVKSVKPPGEDAKKSVSRSITVSYGLTYDDLDRIRTTLESLRYAVPVRQIRKEVRRGTRARAARIVGTVPAYLDVTRSRVARGRFITAMDLKKKNNICVLAPELARHLFGYRSPVGRRVRVQSDYYLVVGVLRPRASRTAAGGDTAGSDFSNDMYIPLATARHRFGDLLVERQAGSIKAEKVELHRLTVQVASTDQVEPAARLIREVLETTHKKRDFEMIVPLELLERARRTAAIWSLVLGCIAGISLVVGGIGIMNIMLATVTERTREIGIRRALGARRRDITMQFLIETLVLSVFGGLLGIALGLLVPWGVSAYFEIRTIVTAWSLILAFGISALVGIVFGLYPARRAAQMHPVEALRHE